MYDVAQATCEFRTLFDAVNGLDLTLVWKVSWYGVEESSRPIARFLPLVVPIVRLGDKTDQQVWPRARKRESKRAGQGAAAAEGGTNEDSEPDEALVDEDKEPEEAEVGEASGLDEDRLERILEEAADLFFGSDEEGDLGDVAPAPPTPPAPAPAGSSGDVPPPPAAVAPEAIARGPMGRAAATVVLPNGRISFYADRGRFEAVCKCKNPSHGKCVATRNNRGRPDRGAGPDAPPIGGRPLGMLSAWLALDCPSKESHFLPGSFVFSPEERLAHRRALALLPGGPELLSHERDKVGGEDSEPDWAP